MGPGSSDLHSSGRGGGLECHTLVCATNLRQVDLAVSVNRLRDPIHWDVGFAVHPLLDQVYQFCGVHAICVEQVGLVDDLILVAATEEAGVYDVFK